MIGELLGLPNGQITLTQTVSLLVAPVLGMVTHELMHYITARAFGQWARIDAIGDCPVWAVWAWQPGVDYEVPDSDLQTRLILLAPVMTGIASLGVITHLGLSGWAIIPVGLWWFVHTLGGGVEDYSIAFSQQEISVSLWTKQWTASMTCFAVFMVLGTVDPSVIQPYLNAGPRLIQTVGILKWNVSLAAMYSSLILMGMAVKTLGDWPSTG